MPTVQAILSHKDFLKIDKNYEAAASMVKLRYVSDQDDGIKRTKKGKGFSYSFRGKIVTDENDLSRIKKLAIPPAWTSVWICPYANGHIQATGFDVRGRKQYRYHTRWALLQQETKFHRMYEFGKALPTLRKRIEKDIAQDGFPASKVMAMIVSLMDRTHIRIGNEGYEKLYGSYGLTTFKNNHADVKGSQITFSFKGKKGVQHKVTLKSKRFARIIKQCKGIPGKELFQYYDNEGELHKVDSGNVNDYIRETLSMDFTSKDFRTWGGTLCMMGALKSSVNTCKADYQKNITAAFQLVSAKLGNTLAVCKKYYVHPELVRMYKEDLLTDYMSLTIEEKDKKYGLTGEEEVLMRFLGAILKEKVVLAQEA